jgi:hypothetical protein
MQQKHPLAAQPAAVGRMSCMLMVSTQHSSAVKTHMSCLPWSQRYLSPYKAAVQQQPQQGCLKQQQPDSMLLLLKVPPVPQHTRQQLIP